MLLGRYHNTHLQGCCWCTQQLPHSPTRSASEPQQQRCCCWCWWWWCPRWSQIRCSSSTLKIPFEPLCATVWWLTCSDDDEVVGSEYHYYSSTSYYKRLRYATSVLCFLLVLASVHVAVAQTRWHCHLQMMLLGNGNSQTLSVTQTCPLFELNQSQSLVLNLN